MSALLPAVAASWVGKLGLSTLAYLSDMHGTTLSARSVATVYKVHLLSNAKALTMRHRGCRKKSFQSKLLCNLKQKGSVQCPGCVSDASNQYPITTSHPMRLSGPRPLSTLIKHSSDQVIRWVLGWLNATKSLATLASALVSPGHWDKGGQRWWHGKKNKKYFRG